MQRVICIRFAFVANGRFLDKYESDGAAHVVRAKNSILTEVNL